MTRSLSPRHLLVALVGASLLTACASSEAVSRAPQAEETAPTGLIAWTVTDVWVAPDISDACAASPVPRAYFAFDSARLSDEAKGRIDTLAKCLSGGPLSGHAIEVIGHTDPRGPADYNEELARERAKAVAKELERHGVAPRCVTLRSPGEAGREDLPEAAYPIARRVDVKLDTDRVTCRP